MVEKLKVIFWFFFVVVIVAISICAELIGIVVMFKPFFSPLWANIVEVIRAID